MTAVRQSHPFDQFPAHGEVCRRHLAAISLWCTCSTNFLKLLRSWYAGTASWTPLTHARRRHQTYGDHDRALMQAFGRRQSGHLDDFHCVEAVRYVELWGTPGTAGLLLPYDLHNRNYASPASESVASSLSRTGLLMQLVVPSGGTPKAYTLETSAHVGTST
jgi:hypothetical protein